MYKYLLYYKTNKNKETVKKKAQYAIYQNASIDEKHTEMLKSFDKNEKTVIPELERQIELLNIQKEIYTDDNIIPLMEIDEKIQEKKSEINRLKRFKKEYLLNNSKYIFHYFENKREISVGKGQTNTDKLNKFFKLKTSQNITEDIDGNEKYQQSRQMYQMYWKNVNNEIANIQDYVFHTDICYYCGDGEFIFQEDEGILLCNNTKCGKFIPHIVDNVKTTNKDPPNEISYTAYIRLNHFKEIISQFQAKETTQIHPDIIAKIRNRFKKERITDMSKLTNEDMREILRKLELNKYFEHIQYIKSLFGVKPPTMNETLIETLFVLFIEIQPKFSIYCPSNRTNFLPYGYILYQLCVLLDQHQYLPYITMLKDVEKQRDNDNVWRNICASLGWLFIPSV